MKDRVRPLNSARAAAKRPPPANLAPHCWRPGQSGNPGGFNGEHGEALRLAREASPAAVHRLIALMGSDDERVAVVACNAILDRALGKAKEATSPPTDEASPRVQSARKHTRAILIAALDAMAQGKLAVPEVEPEDGEDRI